MTGPVVVAGATGFVGRRLVAALEAAGRPVRRGTRDPAAGRTETPTATWVELDVDRPDTLRRALEGADALVYLVHQMREDHGADLVSHERAAARAVREAAEQAGLRRIVFLGGPVPAGTPSRHLAARLATGEELRAGTTSTIELRSAMIIGVGSESWTMTRDLAARLPVMVLPAWLATRSQPIGVADVVAALVHAVDDDHPGSAAFDLPGPEVLTAREILERIAAARGMRPLMIPVPLLTPALSAGWLRLVTRADFAIARQLVDGLAHDLVADGDGYWERMAPRRPTPFDAVVAATFAEESGTLSRRARTWERLARGLSRAPHGGTP